MISTHTTLLHSLSKDGYRSADHLPAAFGVDDIVIRAYRQGFSVHRAIPGNRIACRAEDYLPVTVEYLYHYPRIGIKVPDLPGIIDAISIGRKSIGHFKALQQPDKNRITYRTASGSRQFQRIGNVARGHQLRTYNGITA